MHAVEVQARVASGGESQPDASRRSHRGCREGAFRASRRIRLLLREFAAVLRRLVVTAWLVGLIVGASDRFESAAAGGISALTLVLVALLKNAELRSERAIQRKLDAIASSLLQDKRGGEGDSERDLEQAIGVHEEI